MINIPLHATDVYTWRVLYQDGTQIPEFDESRPDGRGFAEVDSSQVVALELLQDQEIAHRASILAHATPVFVRRRRIVVNPEDESIVNCSTVHCIGWNRGEDTSYLFIFEDGSTLLSSDFMAV